MSPEQMLTHAAAFGAGGFVTGLVTFFVTRHFQRKDQHEEQRVEAYRSVFRALGDLRAECERVHSAADFNQPPRSEDFTASNTLTVAAHDLIERTRIDTGTAFADSAKAVVEYWDSITSALWERDYESPPIAPSFEEREAALKAAVPAAYRRRVLPGG